MRRGSMGGGTAPGQRPSRTGLPLAATSCLLSSFLLSSCGIPSTGVVEAGEGATGIRPAQVLYFLRDDTLFGISRRTYGPLDVGTAVETLFNGPDDLARRKGLTTALPPLTSAPTVRTSGRTKTVTATIQLPRGTEPLPRTALAQLTCTAADALRVEHPHAHVDADGSASESATKVTVTVPGVWRTESSSEMCPGTVSPE